MLCCWQQYCLSFHPVDTGAGNNILVALVGLFWLCRGQEAQATSHPLVLLIQGFLVFVVASLGVIVPLQQQ